MISEILVILTLILINGVFAMSEIALVSARKSKLESLIKKGSQNAKIALKLSSEPNKFLSTVQIGITLIGILNGLFSKNIVSSIEISLQGFAPIAVYSHSIAIVINVVLIGFFSLVLGELVPKRLGLINPEGIATIMAVPMLWLSKITRPFVWLLTHVSELFIKLLNIKPSLDSKVTEEEIRAIIQEGTDGGEIHPMEQDIVERVFNLGDVNVGSLMTHRSDLIWIDVKDTADDIRETIKKELHSAYPVCDGELDKVLGMVFLKDLYVNNINQNIKNLKNCIKPALFIPENNSAYKVLELLKSHRVYNSLVIDEYGTVQGMVTLNDIMDALVGNVIEIAPNEQPIILRDNGEYLIDGQWAFFEFLQYFDIEFEEKTNELDFHTIGGFVINQLRTIPHTGDKFSWRNFNFEIVDMDSTRIDKILLSIEK